MSDAPDRSNAASEKRRSQARERHRSRGNLNRHYLEEAALRALEAGTLRNQHLDLTDRAWDCLTRLSGWLGAPLDTVMNQAICFSASLVDDQQTNVADLERLFHETWILPFSLEFIPFDFKPTPEAVKHIIRSKNRKAVSIYGNSGLILLSRALEAVRQDPKRLLSMAGQQRLGISE